MISECQKLCLTNLSVNHLVSKLFLQSHRHICGISPNDLIMHVTNGKATLRINRQHSQTETHFDRYIKLSDFYKNWVITEICSEQLCFIRRSKIIQYFIDLAYKAWHVGHIDLFFSLMSGLDSSKFLVSIFFNRFNFVKLKSPDLFFPGIRYRTMTNDYSINSSRHSMCLATCAI